MKLLRVCSGVLILCLLPALPDTANGQAEPRLPDGAPASAASRPALTAAAAWELRLLGCDTPEKMAELRTAPKRRRVRVAIVGQDGVSRIRLGHLLRGSNTLTYHGYSDPERNTHDTQMASVMLELTNPLGVSLDLHVWQAGPDFADYARKFRIAAREADIVVLFQSFWGPDAGLITRAIRESPQALFVSPYVEYGGKPTSHTPQGSACRPWDPDTIAHFVTVAPLARRGPPGVVVTPSDRGPDDTEIINFIAPSYHANGPGGTCPSAAVAVACAAYLWAVALDEPQPTGIIAAMRDGATFDRELLAATPEFDTASIERLATQLERLRRPSAGRRRLLDADGILNLYRAPSAADQGPRQRRWHAAGNRHDVPTAMNGVRRHCHCHCNLGVVGVSTMVGGRPRARGRSRGNATYGGLPMHKWRKVAMLASVGAFLPALVVCDLPDHGSIFGIDYEIRSHDGFDFGDLFDMFDRHRHDDCWFFCDDDDGWDFDFDFDFD